MDDTAISDGVLTQQEIDQLMTAIDPDPDEDIYEETTPVSILQELADIAACLSGDLHTLHLNITGDEFDSLHRVFKKLYEAAADDFDAIAEMVRRKPWREAVLNPNGAAERLNWLSLEGGFSRADALVDVDRRLQLYLENMNFSYGYFDKDTDCFVSQGVASWLQDRMNYWGSEWGFFNESRMEGAE